MLEKELSKGLNKLILLKRLKKGIDDPSLYYFLHHEIYFLQKLVELISLENIDYKEIVCIDLINNRIKQLKELIYKIQEN